MKSTYTSAFWTMGASAAAAFLMMSQIYMVAPITGEIARNLKFGGYLKALMIPSITLPIACSALFSRSLISCLGERTLARATALALAIGPFLSYLSPDGYFLVGSRILTGLCLGSLLPLSFRFITQNFPVSQRFFPIMIIVFGMAGGMTFGPVLGAMFYPYFGWRADFLAVAILSLIFFFLVNHYSNHIVNISRRDKPVPLRGKIKYGIIWNGGSLYILSFIFLNGIFHAGLFVWTISTVTERYGLGDISLGLLLLDFGLPGLFLVVVLGLFSRGPSSIKMEFIGLAILGFCIILIILQVAPWLTFLAIAFLSIGYNITQPLFFGIVRKINNSDKAQMALNLGCCLLFTGYGIGPLIFGRLLEYGNLPSVFCLLFLVACLATISKTIFRDDE